MKYLVIGLGIYGANLARDLTDMGHEVIGADRVAANVEAIKDYISTAYILDASDEQEIAVLPIKSVDAVIVAIGENFGASVKTVALLKKLGVKQLFARAVDSIHQSILEGLSVDRILKPEQWAARNLVSEMQLGARVSTLPVSPETFVMRFTVPNFFWGIKYTTLDLQKHFNLQLIAATRSTETTNFLGLKSHCENLLNIEDPSLTVENGDTFVCYGASKDLIAMMRKVADS